MQKTKLEKLLTNDRPNSFICYNPQHVLISLLLSYNHSKNNYLYICNRYPAYKRLSEKINLNCPSIQKAYGIDDLGLRQKYKSKNIFKKIKKLIFYQNHLKNIFENQEYTPHLSDSDIFMFHDGQFLSQYILTHHQNIHLIEEGVGNYASQKFNPLSILKKIHGIYPPYGYNPRINNIFVENIEQLPKKLKDRGALFDKENYFKNITEDLGRKLKRIFLKEDLLNNIKSKDSALLITQPFSEDYFISEEKKIDLYTKIANKLTKKKQLYIKPHPRETTDYNFLQSSNIKILDRNFPIEIINLFDNLNFDIIVTLSSSSIDYLSNKNTYKLGDILDEKEKYFDKVYNNLNEINL